MLSVKKNSQPSISIVIPVYNSQDCIEELLTQIIQNLNESAWIANERSDVSEEITWLKPNLIDQNLFRPINTLFKPIWALEGKKKVYGVGTTFGYKNLPINYHHFYSRNFMARLHFFLISFIKFINNIKKINSLSIICIFITFS